MEFFEQLKAKCPCLKKDPETAAERRAKRREKRRTAVNAVVQHERRKARRRFRKNYVWPVVRTLVLILSGAWLGIHRNVVKAWIKAEPVPQGPHPWCNR
jgi:hypothetical protein